MTVKSRTDEDILAYLKRNAYEGKLAKSLLEIANEVGYSNATVHRVLKRLEEKHLVTVERQGRKANEPSVITYLGSPGEDALLEEGTRLVNDLKNAADELLRFFQKADRDLRAISQDAEEWRDLRSRMVSVTDLPQGLKLMTIREDNPARHIV